MCLLESFSRYAIMCKTPLNTVGFFSMIHCHVAVERDVVEEDEWIGLSVDEG